MSEIEEASEEEVLEKIVLAKSIQKKWGSLELEKRIEILREVYNGLKENKNEIVNLISKEMGKPITQSENEVKTTLDNIKWDLDNAERFILPEITFESDKEVHKVFYEPRGVVISISPFNYPFALWSVITIQNLIVGNVVINKPDPTIPLLYNLLERIFNSSNLPKGVQQFVYGGKEIGSFLVNQDIDMICFIGSTKAGEYLYKVAANKMIPILMELGGSAPGIIFEDADIDNIVEGVFKKRFSNTGQSCHALKRLIVHESKFDEVVEKLKDISGKQIIGDTMSRNTTIGSIVSEEQLNTLLEQFNDAVNKGAEVVCGGKRLEYLKGSYLEPTILTSITKDMKVWREEVFGPILPIISFKTINEAIELANDTIYGLGGYVFTTNKRTYEKVSKDLKSGMVGCNNLVYIAPYNPFGGYRKSGIGRIRGKWGFRELCNIKIITFEK